MVAPVPVPTESGPKLGVQDLVGGFQQVQIISAPSITERSIISGTEASRYDRKLDDMLETQFVISYASTSFDVYGNVVDLPLPPAEAAQGMAFFCPHCGILCPSRHGKDRAWRAHVLQDLQPYVCTYPNCPDGFEMYSSRHAWLEHERLIHRRVW